MKYGHIPGSDKPIGRIVQGTIMLHDRDMEFAHPLLDSLYEQGCNAFDSAHGYGGGGSERTLGEWIDTRKVRDEVFILTKGCHPNADRDRVTTFDLSSDLHDSLVRLRTDHIDLYLLHRDDPSKPVGPLVDRLNQHLQEGKILAYGGSNWSAARIAEANKYAAANGCAPFVASSPNFSLADPREIPFRGCLTISGQAAKEERKWYQKQKMPLFTWSSLAQGFFSGRFRRDNLDTFPDPYDQLCVRAYCSEENFERLDRAVALGTRTGLTLPQIAVAYVLNYPLNIFALIGCQAPEEWQANVAAMDLALSPSDLQWLDTGTGPSPL